MNNFAKATTTLAAGLMAGMIAFTPIAGAATTDVADGQASTATSHPNQPISVESGAPLGDENLGTAPLIPFGTDPQSPVKLGYIDRNHDEGITANGAVDTPF
jgi:hypothetical protein